MRFSRLSVGLEYSTKIFVFLSTVVALFLATALAARGWVTLLPLTTAAFLAGAVGSFALGSVSVGAVLPFAYVVPALMILLHGEPRLFSELPWIAALLGAIGPAALRRPWAFPVSWKAPLVLWALTIASTWPVVVLRELDFTPQLIYMYGLPVASGKVNPAFATVWICSVTVGLSAGLLWFDWLFETFRDRPAPFIRGVVLPLMASWAFAVGTGIYQLFADMSFLNGGLFGALRRASGTMYDANPFGLVAAVWGPAAVAAAPATRRPLRGVALLAVLASWLAVWASAGRTAFAAIFIASAFLAYASWLESDWRERMSVRRRVSLGAGLALAAIVVTVLVLLIPAERGPIPRLRNTLPIVSSQSIGGFVASMWNRDGYGLVSGYLIKSFPFFGVGVGAFHLLVSDVYFLLTHDGFIRADNAQNWYRHQLVEYGIVGSIGWIWWTVAFGWFVLATRSPAGGRLAGTIVKGVIVAIALVSLLGMPSQNVAVGITFWTFAFWYVLIVGKPARPEEERGHHLPLAAWAAIGAVVAASVAGTAYTARHELRVPQRAIDAGWPYAYGFSTPDSRVNLWGNSGEWTGRHAVAVLTPTTRWVKLTVSVDRLNVARGAVPVRVNVDSEGVIDAAVNSPAAIVRYVPVPAGRSRIMIETWVGRTVRPSDYGASDGREHGLLLEWDFVDRAPADASPRTH